MNHFEKMAVGLPERFRQLATSEPFANKSVAAQEGRHGIYAFFENGKPAYVGRTRNLRRRLSDHTARTHKKAAFAFRRARSAMNMPTTHTAKWSRAALEKDPAFMFEVDRQIALIGAMQVRFVETTDKIEQLLLEVFAAAEWGLSLDEFDTH
jgi:predicted GIY-YIG superfamily endonuclease